MVSNVGQRLLFPAGAATVTFLLMLAAGALGPAGVMLNLFIPLPVALTVVRVGIGPGIGALALTTAGLLAVGDPVGVGGYLVQFGLGSVLLPVLLRRDWPWDRAVAATVVTVILAGTAAAWGLATWRGLSLGGLISEYVQGEVQRAMELYRQADLSSTQLAELQDLARRTGAFLVQAYPGLALVVTGIIQLVTLVFLAVTGKGRFPLPGVPFRQWRSSEWLIWLLIAGGFGTAFTDDLAHRVALNLLTVLLPVYFLQGLSVVSFFFARKGISPAFRGLGYLLITLLNPLPLIVTGIGIFDLWADFRKPRIKKT
jgi:uncharacterized protein YybS (DUF2232 family)